MTLKDRSRVGMIDHRIQDSNAMNGASYFSQYFSPSLSAIEDCAKDDGEEFFKKMHCVL